MKASLLPTEVLPQEFPPCIRQRWMISCLVSSIGQLFFLDSLKGRLISESWLTKVKDQNYFSACKTLLSPGAYSNQRDWVLVVRNAVCYWSVAEIVMERWEVFNPDSATTSSSTSLKKPKLCPVFSISFCSFSCHLQTLIKCMGTWFALCL